MIHSNPGLFTPVWQDDARSILVLGFPQMWTMAEVFPVLDRMADMMDAGASKQAVIFDLTGTQIPQDSPQHFRELLTSRVIEHHALGLVVVITDYTRPVVVMVNIFTRLHHLFHDFPLIRVNRLDKALETIAQFRADN